MADANITIKLEIVPEIMQGSNELHICEAEMLRMVQEYLSKRLGSYAPFVRSVKQRNYVFIIELNDKNAF